MRILLLNPPPYLGVKFIREGRCEQRLSSFQYVMVPISLPSIASVLRTGDFEVELIDCIVENLGLPSLLARVASIRPHIVIVNFSTPTFHGDSATVASLKEHFHNTFICAFGVHVTALAEESLRGSKLDAVIRGEPEITAFELAKVLGTGGDLDQVQGISFKRGGAVVHNQDRPFYEELDRLPFPARDLLPNERYTMPVSKKPYTLIITSRGCPYHCIYCTARNYYGSRHRKRSAANIADEIEEIVNKYGIKVITMWSDTFTLERGFVEEVCHEIVGRRLRIEWMCNSRVDKVDLDLLVLMKRAGCKIISFGVESGSEEIMQNIKKAITLQQTERAFRETRQAGIESAAHVIFGLPGETPETIKQTIRFVKKIKPDYAQFYGAIPFPGTEFFEIAVQNDWLTTMDYDSFEINRCIVDTPLLSVEELSRMRREAYKDFYLRPGYIFSRLLKLRSWDDLTALFQSAISFFRDWVLAEE